MKKIIVEYLVSSQKTAILEDDKLIELLIEDNKNSKKVSNIYRGVVKKVIPGIQACFVDIGFEKLAYLQLDKDSNIKAGQDILVQVNKEEVGTKGAKLNTEISLAGRYLVYIPTNDRITISNKILDEKERFRLKKIANSVSKGAKGLIIRTEAVGCTKEELEADINELKERYEEIIKEYKLGIGPKLLYKELDFSSKYIKDNVNEDIEKIVTNDKCKYDELKNILKSIKKEYGNNQRSPKTLLFVFDRFACRPAAFLSVWGGQPEREASLFNLKFLAARVLVYVRQLADGRVFAASTAFCSLDSLFSAVPAALVPMGTRWVISPFSST